MDKRSLYSCLTLWFFVLIRLMCYRQLSSGLHTHWLDHTFTTFLSFTPLHFFYTIPASLLHLTNTRPLSSNKSSHNANPLLFRGK